MILNPKRASIYISDWIKDYATKTNRKNLIVGLSGGVDSALTALLCRMTGIPTDCVNIPCHSSEASFNRAKAFTDSFGLYFHKVDVSSCHESIINQSIFPSDSKKAAAALRSCLRAPVLSFYAYSTQGIVVGTRNRSENNIVRHFHKYGDGCIDIAPIADLFKSEVYQLFEYLTKSNDIMPQAALDIWHTPPATDLWGPDVGLTDEAELGVTYSEIEWADRENLRSNIISSDDDPTKFKTWFGYTLRQKEIIAKLHQLEKLTRHKVNPALPICAIRPEKSIIQ